MSSRPWDVYIKGELIDTVWFDSSMEEMEVVESLVTHDGYDPDIYVKARDDARGFVRRHISVVLRGPRDTVVQLTEQLALNIGLIEEAEPTVDVDFFMEELQ